MNYEPRDMSHLAGHIWFLYRLYGLPLSQEKILQLHSRFAFRFAQINTMNLNKSVVYFINIVSIVTSSKLLGKLKTTQANSALLKDAVKTELIYYGSDLSLTWRFEKMARWYGYKVHYLGNNIQEMEVKLKNHLETLAGDTVILLLNSDSAWINKGPKQLLK